MADEPTIKLLAVMEPKTVSGAAKNMLEFCKVARELDKTLSRSTTIQTSIVTFERGGRNSATRSIYQAGQSDQTSALPSIEGPNEFVRAASELGLEVDIIPERFRFDMRVIPALREVVVRRAPDIVLTHHVKSHFLMKMSRLWREYPWVAFHHGYTKTHLRENLYNLMDRISLPTATRVITVCDAFARELINAGVSKERISVQHNCITLEQTASADDVQAVKTRFGISEGERMILAIGRLSSEKAHIDLLSAFQHLLRADSELKARLVIVGDGPERTRLEEAAASSGFAGHVRFAGQLSDVNPFYAAADVLVLPSHSEGSPYVLLEAMAAGLPIVATAVGGVPEMVEDEESALLVPAREPQRMAAAIARVLDDEQLARKLAANASHLVKTRYSPGAYIRSLVGIYRGILDSRYESHPSRPAESR